MAESVPVDHDAGTLSPGAPVVPQPRVSESPSAAITGVACALAVRALDVVSASATSKHAVAHAVNLSLRRDLATAS